MPPFNRRAFVSLMIALFISVMLMTSLLMFFKPHTALIASVHTGIGFILLAFVGWHLKNNFASLKTYFSLRAAKSRVINLALITALLCGGAVVSLALTQMPPFTNLYAWGNQLRGNQQTTAEHQFTYVRQQFTRQGAQGTKLTIDLRKGAYFHYPQYALWLETLDGAFIQPLFVTEKLARNDFANKVRLRNPQQVFNADIAAMDEATWQQTFTSETLTAAATQQRTRPESLPVFLHQLATKPTKAMATEPGAASAHVNIDAYAGATLLDNFLLTTQSEQPLPAQFRLRLEINQSFDFNTFYSSDRFPNDPIYSGDGYNGQPSVIYEAIINTQSEQRFYPMALIGRGHHSGSDGIIHTDMENLTTAKQLIDRVIVEFTP